MSEVSLLVILDGFGYREDRTDNAIAQADTPTEDNLWAHRPHTLISGSGEDVGREHRAHREASLRARRRQTGRQT